MWLIFKEKFNKYKFRRYSTWVDKIGVRFDPDAQVTTKNDIESGVEVHDTEIQVNFFFPAQVPDKVN